MNARAATLVQGGFGFIEGPLWLADKGVLLFSDMDFNTYPQPNGPNARIRRYTPSSGFDVFAEGSNSNGLALDHNGDILAATHDVQSLSRFDPDTAVRTPLALTAPTPPGAHFNSPNDLVVSSDGNVYFTDPDWQLGPRDSETDSTSVYRVAPDGSVSVVDDTLDKPNGITLSPDERTLYVGSAGNEIYSYRVKDDGSVDMRASFVTTGAADGLTIDCAGNLYVTAGTVQVFAPDKQKLGDITLAGTPSNVAFGGSDQKTLFITAGSELYSIELEVPGRAY